MDENQLSYNAELAAKLGETIRAMLIAYLQAGKKT